ncbi:spore germination protein GerW family protein [Pseudonocardia sp.]|uniref:spore germination protein GerW family protein n=1 Tax=Pseudonocardia sp. TaxID=60912 RepID=UPI003D0FC155
MDATEVVTRSGDALTVRRVFGEPIERDGVTIVPVARIVGGGGAGAGEGGPDDGGSTGSGSGGGYGLGVRPVGAFVLRDGTVTWRPAVDVNRVILGGQLVAVVALLVLRSYLRLRARQGD